MESWDDLVANYSREVDLRTLCKVMRTALLTLQKELQEFEAERLATTFLFYPISALDLIRFLEEDSVWTKPLCDIFKVITTLINKFPNSVQSFHDEIVVACRVPAKGRALSSALRCLQALSKHTTPATVPNALAADLRTEPNARIERALLLGTLCELYPETVTDVEDVSNALLDLLAATNYSDSVSEAALRSIAQMLRHFSSDLSAQQLTQIHRHLSRHIYCKRCREVVLRTVEEHASSLGACAAQSSVLRVRVWTRPTAAAALYCALLPLLSPQVKQKIITDELLPRINNPRAGVRGAARCVLTAVGHPVPRYKVPGYQDSEDVYGLRLKLLAGCEVDYELADTIWWCIENQSEGNERLLDACVCAQARFPYITRRKLLARAFYASSAEHVLRRIDLIIHQDTTNPTALQRFTSLCSELFHKEQRTAEQLRAEQLLNLLLSVLVGELDSFTEYLMENDVTSKLPATKSRAIFQIKAVLAVANASRLPVNKGLLSRLRTALRVVGLRCGPAGDAVELLRLYLEAHYNDDLGAGDTTDGVQPSATEVLAKLHHTDRLYFIDRIDILAKHFLSDPLILSRPEMSRDTGVLCHVTRWCVSRDNTSVPAGLSELIDASWSSYVSSQGTSAGVHLLTIASRAVRPGGTVASWAGALLAGAADVEDKARVLAALGDRLLSGGTVDSVISEIRESLPARLEECKSGQAAGALLALLVAAAGEQREQLLDMLAALAAGPSEVGWWEDALAGGLQASCAGAYSVAFLLGVFRRVLTGNNPGAAGDRLLLPILRNTSEEAQSQLFSEALPTLVTTLQRTKHAKHMPRALLALRLILLMMETVPPQSISDQSWRVLRDVCVLCVALRKLHATDQHETLVFQQTSYRVLCSVLMRRKSPPRACMSALGIKLWTLIVDDSEPYLPLPLPIQETDRNTAFLDELVEDSHQYDLFGDGPFPEYKTQATKPTSSPWNPCIESISCLLQHLATSVEDKTWCDDICEGLTSDSVPLRWMVADAVCSVHDELGAFASHLAPPLLTIATEDEDFNSLHLLITDILISWGLSPQWPLSAMTQRLAGASCRSTVVVSRLARVLRAAPELAREELLGPLLCDDATAEQTYKALCEASVPAPAVILVSCLNTQPLYRDLIIKLLGISLESGQPTAELQPTMDATVRRVRRDSVRQCLHLLAVLPHSLMGNEWHRWSVSVRARLGAIGKRALSA